MKALVLKSPWAQLVASGHKTIEVRSRTTHYRGPILIVLGLGIDREATLRVIDRGPKLARSWPQGHAIAKAVVTGCFAMNEVHEKAALVPARPGLWAWYLSEVQPIIPFPVKGQLGIFNVPVPESAIVLDEHAYCRGWGFDGDGREAPCECRAAAR